MKSKLIILVNIVLIVTIPSASTHGQSCDHKTKRMPIRLENEAFWLKCGCAENCRMCSELVPQYDLRHCYKECMETNAEAVDYPPNHCVAKVGSIFPDVVVIGESYAIVQPEGEEPFRVGFDAKSGRIDYVTEINTMPPRPTTVKPTTTAKPTEATTETRYVHLGGDVADSVELLGGKLWEDYNWW